MVKKNWYISADSSQTIQTCLLCLRCHEQHFQNVHKQQIGVDLILLSCGFYIFFLCWCCSADTEDSPPSYTCCMQVAPYIFTGCLTLCHCSFADRSHSFFISVTSKHSFLHPSFFFQPPMGPSLLPLLSKYSGRDITYSAAILDFLVI